jgi:tRNA A37 methylthiotransferase MiaB
MEVTENPEEADVLLLNTCSIREKAQEKVFSLLGRWRKIKQKRPDIIIGVGGCVASQEGEAIQKRAPEISTTRFTPLRDLFNSSGKRCKVCGPKTISPFCCCH